jgi:hypothetical protein
MAITFPQLFTSRFGARKLITASGLAPIRISLGGPRWPLGFALAGECPLLAPFGAMLKMDQELYTRVYRDRLDRLGVATISAALQELSDQNDGRGLVLLCFEDLAKPGQWCHRRLFAAWFEEQTGIPVPELVAVEQPALFE